MGRERDPLSSWKENSLPQCRRVPGTSCVLRSSGCSPADEGENVERREKYMKALECRVHSISAASAAACQSLGISLPISKPATQIADPRRNVCSLGKAGCTPLKCLLARGMHGTARAAHVEGGETCRLSSHSLLGPVAQRGGSQGWSHQSCRHVRLCSVCPGPSGSFSLRRPSDLSGARTGAGEVKEVEGRGERAALERMAGARLGPCC